MSVLLLNQAFWPDVVSTAQHAGELARGLVARGHAITVIAARRAYDSPEVKFKAREDWHGVSVIRVPCSGFGKTAFWRRAADFATFLLSTAARLAVMPRFDTVVAMTSPPMLPALAALYTALRGGRLVVWLMDLNPDEAVAAGWLRKGSPLERVLDAISTWSLRRADEVVGLDRFMRQRVIDKGVDPEKMRVIPPWSHDENVRYDPAGREEFRRRHGLQDKFVVMYSGNHTPCHPLDTLLGAAEELQRHHKDTKGTKRGRAASLDGGSNGATQPELAQPLADARGSEASVVFCFVGGGSEMPRVRRFARERGLDNIVCLPYQPLEGLAASLSAADLHAVVMGDGFVGIVHPCKIYNILAVGAPFLYIGPEVSHITELMPEGQAWAVRHGDVEGAVDAVQKAGSHHKDTKGTKKDWNALAEMVGCVAVDPQEGVERKGLKGDRRIPERSGQHRGPAPGESPSRVPGD